MLFGGFALAKSRTTKPAKQSEIDAKQALKIKLRRMRRIQRILASSGAISQKGKKLFRLAQLELEVSVLQEEEKDAAAALSAAETNARRLLIEVPKFSRAAEVRLLLARVLMRQKRYHQVVEVVDDIRHMHGKSGWGCEGDLLAASALNTIGRMKPSMLRYRDVMERKVCSAISRGHAQYQFAWNLIKQDKTGQGAEQLRDLLARPGLGGVFRERVLRDLALAWTSSKPDAVAARTLIRHGGETLGWTLVKQVCSRLAEQGRAEAVLGFTSTLLKAQNVPGGFQDATAAATLTVMQRLELRRLRMAALAKASRVELLEREISQALKEADPSVLAALRKYAAGAIFQLAQRLDRIEDRKLSRRLYEKLLTLEPNERIESQARLSLADHMAKSGALADAELHLRRAVSLLKGGKKADARYQLLIVLQQRLAKAGVATGVGQKAGSKRADAVKVALRQRALLDAGWAFAQANPKHKAFGDVLILVLVQATRLDDYQATADAADLFLRRYRKHPRRREVFDLAIQVASKRQRWPAVYDLVKRAGCLSKRKAQCAEMRKQAARSALAESRSLIAANELKPARKWASRALHTLEKGSLRNEVLFHTAILASKTGALGQSIRLFRTLEAEDTGKWRRRAQKGQAELWEAQARFLRAARTYRRASQFSVTISRQLHLLIRAAENYHWAKKPDKVRKLRGVIGRVIAGDPFGTSRKYRWWVLRLGRLLKDTNGPAYAYYLGKANALWRDHSRLSASCLVEAAALAPTRGRRRNLLLQARNLAGSLQRKGKLIDAAVRSRIGIAEILRETWDEKKGPRRPEDFAELQREIATITEILLQKDPKWSAAAGHFVAWALGSLASGVEKEMRSGALAATAQMKGQIAGLRDRRQTILEAVAALAKKPGGLNRYSLRVARELGGLATKARADHLPTKNGKNKLLKPTLALVKRGQLKTALRVATRALQIDPTNGELLCIRAVSYLRLNEPAKAFAELQLAFKSESVPECARLNLGTLAMWQGDVKAAKRYLAGVGEKAPAVMAAMEGEPGWPQ
jgi:Flp pilus assembly protein TadD